MEDPDETHPPIYFPTWLSDPSSVGSYRSLIATNLQTQRLGLTNSPGSLKTCDLVECEMWRRSLLVDGFEQLQGRLDLSLRLAGLHRGANDGDVLALSRHVMSIRDHAHVDVWREESPALEHTT